MSTQVDSGIEFAIVSEEHQQHFRLLELPPELLEIITSNDPPSFQLKSQETLSGESNVVLCTIDKTFQLRQVSTSNTLFVAEPPSVIEGENVLPRTELRAIAQPQSTLEIIPAKVLSAIPYITAILPAYTSTGFYSSKDAISKDELFANIPLSHVECEDGWRELACFELDEERHSVVPSASVKLKVWEALLSSAVSLGIDMTQPLDECRQSTIVNAESDWPDELSQAVLRSMIPTTPGSSEIQLDGQICSRNVSLALLKDRTEGLKPALDVNTFKSSWADLLPEKWRLLADLSLLKGWYSLESDGQEIRIAERSEDSSTTTNGTAPAETKSTLGAKRKWHEKFRASKKTS